ncbi:MAG: diaminopimelate epimerase [Pseudomonadota bacterium]
MPIEFTKMHGIGNDFIVINAIDEPMPFDAQEIRRLSHRRFGIGFDQLLVVEPASTPAAEFNYRIYNADGGEVENCGNGARCFARYVRDKGLTKSDRIPVMTSAGPMTLAINNDGQVTVAMEKPQLHPDNVPFVAEAEATQYELAVDSEMLSVGVAAVGNPHVVLPVASVDSAPVERLGPLIETHERFPNRVNVGFMQVMQRDEIALRVFERGVGETLACGTGACAAVVVGINQGLLDKRVTVHLRGGDLDVHWADYESAVMMTGPCETVFEGRLE